MKRTGGKCIADTADILKAAQRCSDSDTYVAKHLEEDPPPNKKKGEMGEISVSINVDLSHRPIELCVLA